MSTDDRMASEVPMSDHIKRFWQILETETVRVIVNMKRNPSGVEYWDGTSFGDDFGKALLADYVALLADHHRRGIKIIEMSEHCGRHMCRAEKVEAALQPFAKAAGIIEWTERATGVKFDPAAPFRSGLAWRKEDGSTGTLTYGDFAKARETLQKEVPCGVTAPPETCGGSPNDPWMGKLTWVETEGGAWTALAPDGEYMVAERVDGGWFCSAPDCRSLIHAGTLAEAKAAAQSDYEAQSGLPAVPDATSIETRMAIGFEKMLLAKLGREWTPSGISVQSLIDELAGPIPPHEGWRYGEMIYKALYGHQGGLWEAVNDTAKETVWHAAGYRLAAALAAARKTGV